MFEKTIHSQYPNVTIFSNVIPNYPSRLKFSGAWLTFFENVYKTNTEHRWAESKINSLLPSTVSKPKKFDCLLGLSRVHRDFIKSRFIRSDRDQFVFSYYENNKNIMPNGLWSDVLEPGKELPFSGHPIRMECGGITLASNVIPVDIYNQTYFSIVAETTASHHYSFYTEKIVKPIVGQRLFVVFAGQHYLKNLKSLGFQTFDSVIDESYDSVQQPIRRWEQAWKQIEYLATQDPISINKQIEKIVQHNYDLYRNTCWYSGIVDCINHALSN